MFWSDNSASNHHLNIVQLFLQAEPDRDLAHGENKYASGHEDRNLTKNHQLSKINKAQFLAKDIKKVFEKFNLTLKFRAKQHPKRQALLSVDL